MFNKEDLEKLSQLIPFTSGVMAYGIEKGLTGQELTAMVKAAMTSYISNKYGVESLDRWLSHIEKTAAMPGMGGGMGGAGGAGGGDMGGGAMAPAGTDPNALAGQTGANKGMEDPEDTALRSKPVPTNPFDFRNHPAVLQMQKRQRDLLKAKKKELEQSQQHTAGLF
jgi:hypothetical protein